MGRVRSCSNATAVPTAFKKLPSLLIPLTWAHWACAAVVASISSLFCCARSIVLFLGRALVFSGLAWMRPNARPRSAQEARYEPDVWEEAIATYLATVTRATVGQVVREGLGLVQVKDIGTADQRRIAKAMERLRWKRLPKDGKGSRLWGPV